MCNFFLPKSFFFSFFFSFLFFYATENPRCFMFSNKLFDLLRNLSFIFVAGIFLVFDGVFSATSNLIKVFF